MSTRQDMGVHPKTYFFCELKPHAKFWTPMITPSARKVTAGEREKNAVNSGHFVPQQRPRAAHALCSDQNELHIQSWKHSWV